MSLLSGSSRWTALLIAVVSVAVAVVVSLAAAGLAAALLFIAWAGARLWTYESRRARARTQKREMERAEERAVAEELARRLDDLRLGRPVWPSHRPPTAEEPAPLALAPGRATADVEGSPALARRRLAAGRRLRVSMASILVVAVLLTLVIGVARNAGPATVIVNPTPAAGIATATSPSMAASAGPSPTALASSPTNLSPAITEAPTPPTALGSPSGVASASQEPVASHPLPAQIEITPSTRVINLGGTFVISVRVLANGAHRTVTLQSQPGYTAEADAASSASWTYLATLVTDTFGTATYADNPPDSRYYRVTFGGAPDLGAAVSPRARALVRQVYALFPTNSGRIADVARGTVVRFTSTVQPVRPLLAPAKATFVVYQHVGDAWVLVASYDTVIDSAGHAHFIYTFSTPGNFYVRSVARPTPENANSIWTPVELYNVG